MRVALCVVALAAPRSVAATVTAILRVPRIVIIVITMTVRSLAMPSVRSVGFMHRAEHSGAGLCEAQGTAEDTGTLLVRQVSVEASGTSVKGGAGGGAGAA